MKLSISPTAFWDVDFTQLDNERDSLFIMYKVLNHGKLDDIKEVFRFYGKERIRKEIVLASYLKPQAISFICTILDLQKSDFVTMNKRQTANSIWN